MRMGRLWFWWRKWKKKQKLKKKEKDEKQQILDFNGNKELLNRKNKNFLEK